MPRSDSAAARVHPTAIVEDGARLGADVDIGPFCHVGPKVRLDDGVRLVSHVAIEGRTDLGARTIVHPFAAIGGPPQHTSYRGEDTTLAIGEDVVIREHVTMHVGTAGGRGETRVGARSMFMAASHVAHDCQIADDVIFANNATLGGHVVVEEGVFVGGLAAIHQHCRIGAFAFVGGCAAVPNDVIPYGSAIGNHASLGGLNIVGMKRRGLSRDAIHRVRAAYRMLFDGDGGAPARVDAVDAMYPDDENVKRITTFVREGARRPLMAPRR